jgi:NAD-dependent SIR2 family protein deacetylase
VAKQRQSGKEAALIEVNAESTALTEEMVSDYLIQGKTGQILPKIAEEVKRIIGTS